MSQFQGVPGPSQDSFTTLSNQIANIGKRLTTTQITLTTTNLDVPDLSKYTLFIGCGTSSWMAGVAMGVRMSATSIRFGLITQANGQTGVTSYMDLNVSGDKIVSVTGAMGASATGIGPLYGLV